MKKLLLLLLLTFALPVGAVVDKKIDTPANAKFWPQGENNNTMSC